MNGNFYQNPTFPSVTNPNSNSTLNPNTNPNMMPQPSNYESNIDTIYPNQNDNSATGNLTMEQSYIENILRLNKGKKVNAYVSFPDSNEWKDKIFSGIIEEAGRDHLIISDPTTGHWFLILMIYLNYVEFEERINYSHSYSEKTF